MFMHNAPGRIKNNFICLKILSRNKGLCWRMRQKIFSGRPCVSNFSSCIYQLFVSDKCQDDN